ncbi:MAG: crossover junction endodeoxyribonuclease RuvC [Actinobacteria bacterium]|nr:crossover junction endodeoxyribonuclease RuvC [Actinomycetota bacterium]
MLVIGFDPGLTSTGWCVLDTDKQKIIDSGVIKTCNIRQREERLFAIRQSTKAILQGYMRMDPQVAIEDFIFQKRKTRCGEEVPLKSAELLNRVVQVIVSVCWDLGIEVSLYPAPDVKGAIAAYERADKEAMRKAVKLRLSEIPRPSHIVDAAAVALYHADLSVIGSRAVAEVRG